MLLYRFSVALGRQGRGGCASVERGGGGASFSEENGACTMCEEGETTVVTNA